jgi:hypothetical protein
VKLLILLLLTQVPTTKDYVVEIQPGMTEKRAAQLGRDIDRAAKRYDVDPLLLAAITRQESGFQSGLKQCGTATWKVNGKVQSRETCDYGLAQVNQVWIEKWKLDADLLQNNDAYNLMVAARILRLLRKQYGDTEPANWYGRYHSATPSRRADYENRLQPMLLAASS